MRGFEHLDPCEPGTVTPVCTLVAWWAPEPGDMRWLPVPVGTWIDDDHLQWPPHTPGTHHPHDVEDDR